MKKYSKGKLVVMGIVFGLVAGTVFTFAILLLWNWLMPLIFGLGVITFWQALGLLILSKILFGGCSHKHGHWYHCQKSKVHEHSFMERMHRMKEMKETESKNESNAE